MTMKRARLGLAAGLWLFGAGAGAAEETPPESGFKTPSWDRVANIKEAAERLARLQRTKGATGAITHIDACYKTHGLASEYSAPFEACIAQDYLETKVLASVYSQLSEEALQKLRAPSPQKLADAMGRRIVAAFSQYKVPVSYANEFKDMVDLHGFPVMMAILFPKGAAGGNVPEGAAPSDDSDKSEEKK